MNGAKEQLLMFIKNPVMLACLLSWFSSQVIKTFIKLFSGKIHSLGELFDLLIWRTGGMPSSHSAVVTSLCTTIGFRSGLNSDVFILALGFGFVTIRDALGVRRASGIQAEMINSIGENLDEKGLMEYKPIKEVHGHKPIEVLFGCVLGFFIGFAFSVL